MKNANVHNKTKSINVFATCTKWEIQLQVIIRKKTIQCCQCEKSPLKFLQGQTKYSYFTSSLGKKS